MPQRARKAAGDALEIGEFAIAMLFPQPGKRIREKRVS